jgi:hypothetical protein
LTFLKNALNAVRDQMMRHNSEFYTFQNAYLNQIANFNLQNAFLEEETEDQLFRVFAHINLIRDPRAIKNMVPDEVWADLPPDSEIVKLEKEMLQGGFDSPLSEGCGSCGSTDLARSY